MLLLISDANILIDMEEGQLLECMFKLPFQFRIPDVFDLPTAKNSYQLMQANGRRLPWEMALQRLDILALELG